MRISQQLFDEPIPPIAFGVDQPVEEATLFRVFNPIIQITLFFMTERLSIANQEFEVTCVGLINGWVVNLIHDAMTEGKPEPAAFRPSGSKTILRARGPARLNSRRPKRHSVDAGIHLARMRL